jgi:hypothetical protein
VNESRSPNPGIAGSVNIGSAGGKDGNEIPKNESTGRVMFSVIPGIEGKLNIGNAGGNDGNAGNASESRNTGNAQRLLISRS